MLYQIEFHATIAEQAGRFSIADVTAGIHDKLVRRHPHVFGDVDADDAGTVRGQLGARSSATEKGRTSVFDGVARSLPALAYAQHLMRKAAKVGFDWPDVDGPLAKVDEELAELREAIAGRRRRRASPTSSATSSSPSSTSPATSASTPSWRCGPRRRKFRRRFEAVEALAAERGVDLRAADLATLDALWDEVKARRALRTAGIDRLAARLAACGCSSPIRRTTRTSGRCRSPPTSTTGTCRTCTACSACTATSCGSSSSARTATARRTSSRSCPTTSPCASTGCCAALVEDRLPTVDRRAPSSPSAPATATAC